MSTPERPKRSEVQTPGPVATRRQRAVSPSAARPVIEGRKLPTNIYVPRKKGPPKGNPPRKVLSATAPGFASNRASGPASISELARALNNDVRQIFAFVHNNIEFIPTYGSQKGALGTLIDGFGNAFDQSELMIALLREGSHTCSFQFGELELSEAEAAAWLGNDAGSIWAASNLLSNCGVPNETHWTGTEWKLRLSHVWVKCTVSGTDYVFDPAMKSYTVTTGIDLGDAIGYDRSNFMDDATDGATITSDYVEDINRTNVRNNLATLAGNLASYIKESAPTATLDDILGGRSIVAVDDVTYTFLTALPYLRPSTTPTTWTDIPNAYKATLSVVYDTIDVSFYSKDIHGKRLTLFFNESHEAELRLDGELVATSDAQIPDSWNSALLTIVHPYPYTWWDQSFWQTVYEGKYYLIAQAWGNAGREMIELHRQKLNQSIFDGGDYSDEGVLGEALSVRWHTWNAQKSWACDVFNRMTQCTTVLQHQIGLVGWFDTPTMDLGGIVWSSGALDNNYDNVNTNDTALAMHGVAFEGGTIEQICGIGGISTTTILDKAVQDELKIYDGRGDNWSANVRPNLTNYESQTLDDIENWYINWDWRVAIPEDGQIEVQDFVGYGYYGISPWQGAVGIFSGHLQGGMGAVALSVGDMVPNTQTGAVDPTSTTLPQCTDNVSNDPIDMQRGSYLYRNTDITTGSGSHPYALAFERFYTSGARLSSGPLGLGWSHNWNHSIAANSDGLLAMANESPLSGATGLVAMFVTMDLYRDLDKPIDKWVTVAITNRWLLDQSRDNTAILSLPGDTQVFVKQADGTYIAPGHESGSLTKNVGGDWTYVDKNKVETSYNSAGQITEIAYPSGVTLTFTYTGGKLSSVSNGMTRELTFTYDGDLLTEVSDGDRSVSFAYDDGNLVTATDPLDKDTTYVYDIPGRMTQVFLPANPVDALVTNVYDSLGRVMTQTDGSSNEWQFFFAGSRSEEKNPEGISRVQYFDADGALVKERLYGNIVTTREYDGLGRLVLITHPEGNQEAFTYDANSNRLTETLIPKPGSSEDPIVKTFTYDPDWNKVATIVDGRSNTTTFTYDETTGDLLTIEYPEVDSVTPTVTNTYNARGQVLTTTDQTGIVTAYGYDLDDETLLTVTKDAGSGRLNLVTTFGYNTAGDITSITDPRGNATTVEYDDARRVKQITPPSPFNANVTKYTYDNNGNRTKIERYAGVISSTPVWQTINATYTVDGLVATLTDPSSHVTEFTYNTLRKLWKREDTESRITTYAYDQLVRLSTITDPSSTVSETRTYTNNGRLHSVKDARNKETVFAYDDFDRFNKRTFEDDTFEQFELDANGNVTKKTTRNGDDIVYVFDVLNRLISKDADNLPTVTYGYDLANRLESVSTPVVTGDPSSGEIEYTHDTAGRLIREEYPDGKQVSYDRDGNGNVTKLTYPGGYYVTRVFDKLNRLTQLKLNGSSSAAIEFGYDELNRRTDLTYENGTTCEYGYQLDDLMTALTQTFDSASVAFGYGYNAAHELTSQSVDDSGYMRHPSGGGTVSYGTANDLNQYPTVASVSQSYNSNGCLTGDGTWTFGYDTENRLTSAAKTGVSASYLYDPLGRQVQKQVGSTKTRFIYAGFQRIADYDGSGTLVARYVYGASVDEPLMVVNGSNTVVAYLHHDKIGSIIATTDAGGDVINSYKYLPWGEGGTLSGTTFGYTGQRYDAETGLYYFKNRYYSAALGRFLQPDPVLYNDSLNTYQYALNNPLMATDPYGLAADTRTDTNPTTGDFPDSSGGGLVFGGGSNSGSGSGSSCSCSCGGGNGPDSGNGSGGSGTDSGGSGDSSNVGVGGGLGAWLTPFGDTMPGLLNTTPLGAADSFIACLSRCKERFPEGVLRTGCMVLCVYSNSN